VRKGDRVALVMRNLPEWPVVFMAALLAGAVVVPLNAWWSGTELAYGILDCGARFVFADAERLARLKDLPPFVGQVFVTRAANPPPGVTVLEDVIGAPSHWGGLPDRPMPDVALSPEDDATIFYTSGTTGAPKGALGTHRSLTTNIFAMPFSNARNMLRRGEPLHDAATKQRITLIAVPFFHVIGSLSILLPNMVAGGKLPGTGHFRWRACVGIPGGAGPCAVGRDAGSGLGHDRNLGHLHQPFGRGLSASSRQLRSRPAGQPPQDHEGWDRAAKRHNG
jgi:long-chain acyl-CoA synthetase